MTRVRLADDFDAIRERLKELEGAPVAASGWCWESYPGGNQFSNRAEWVEWSKAVGCYYATGVNGANTVCQFTGNALCAKRKQCERGRKS